MEVKPIEVYSEVSNYAIIRMPGRKFPGCVVQGDSLANLCGLVRRIREQVQQCSDDELRGDVDEIMELLDDRRHHYEQVLTEHGISLPYSPVEKA